MVSANRQDVLWYHSNAQKIFELPMGIEDGNGSDTVFQCSLAKEIKYDVLLL